MPLCLPHARLYVPVLLGCAAGLALLAARGDSATVDEPGHLVAGLAIWHAADFRMAPDHPPLARLLDALPVLLTPHVWPGSDGPGWHDGDWWRYGLAFFERNDGERLLFRARLGAIAVLCAACFATWLLARALFGAAAAALALVLAAFDPGLLAHGHYVTTDVPLVAASCASLLCFARLMREISAGALAAALVSVCVLALVKLPFVLVLPAWAVMASRVCLRQDGLRLVLPRGATRTIASRWARLGVLAALGAALGLGLWLGIWCGYGLRYRALTGADRDSATMYPRSVFGPPPARDMDEAWELILQDGSGRARAGIVPTLVRFAREHRLLPEAYVYGWAYFDRKALDRAAYLQGEVYQGGRVRYFPLAFLWKTPLASLLLATAGGLLWLRGRVTVRDPVLGLGTLVFAAVHAGACMSAHLNIGQRHLLPIYPAVFALAGAAAVGAAGRVQRGLVAGLALWLVLSTCWNAPHFLGYFNELAGGRKRAHELLADSNVDWSQDLLRLRAWMAAHPHDTVKLAQFGHAPWPKGLRSLPLLGAEPGGRSATLEAGTFVVSVNELLGLFKPYQRAETWRAPGLRAAYAQLWDGGRFDDAEAERRFDALRRSLLVSRLRARPPDERIGSSLFVFRLDAAQLADLTRP